MSFLVRFLSICFSVLICTCPLYAQRDSSSTITVSHYRGDTVYWEKLTIQNFIDDKLVFERIENIIWEDESDFVMTMHYYYLNGELVKTIRVEEDQYVCDLIVQSDNSFLLQVEMP